MRQLLVCWALLLALLWQGVFVQAHHHRLAGPGVKAELAASAKPGRGDPASDTAANCPICLAAANAGPAMLPTPVALAAPVPTTAFTAQVPLSAFGLSSQSHVWQSRAPPPQLQA